MRPIAHESWLGFVMPAGVSAPIVERLADETVRIVALSDTRERSLGADPRAEVSQAFRKLKQAAYAHLHQVVRAADITPQ
jgi:tripartite-type tricarboxylate transporter receptor subunit TctC